MRIAIVLFGHLRSYRQTIFSFENLKNILSRSGNVDVFCHTWDIEESVTAAWWKEHKPDEPPPAIVDVRKIEQIYSPALYSVEPSRQFDDKGYSVNSKIPIPGILSMLYSQMRAFNLLEEYEKQNGFKYDVVVKTRYDLLYEIAGDFANCVSADDGIFLPSSNPYELIGSCSDIFAIGSRKSMEEYFGFCVNFKEALVIYQRKGYQQLLPELCMTVYLDHKNIKRQELHGLRLHILRMSGEKFQVNTDKNFQNNGPLCFYLETILTNRQLLPGKENMLLENNDLLVKKYMSWVDTGATKETLQQYADLYNGKWIGMSLVKRLLSKTKNNSVFNPHVMKNFFEETMRNAEYGMTKKLVLASVLTAYSGQGLFFFRVLKNISFSKN
jgi:hypothetical protein